ncbi:MAG: hypothetical protein JWO20_2608 [Candidatus Angelobacter sp.]|nr:hypothetical protein [Candidatus Angelobacter sp.]
MALGKSRAFEFGVWVLPDWSPGSAEFSERNFTAEVLPHGHRGESDDTYMRSLQNGCVAPPGLEGKARVTVGNYGYVKGGQAWSRWI